MANHNTAGTAYYYKKSKQVYNNINPNGSRTNNLIVNLLYTLLTTILKIEL